MRLVVSMIPIALVGGYVVHSLSGHTTLHSEPHAPIPPLPAVAPVSPVAPVASPAAVSLPHLAMVDAAFPTAFEREVADGQIRVRGAASANMVAAIEGALQLVSRRLSEGDSVDAALAAELVTWSASLLADVAADVEGYIEIETADGERVVINAAGHPSIRVAPR